MAAPLAPPPVVRRIMIIVAMEQEMMPIVASLGLHTVDPSPFLPGAPFVAWEGEVNGDTAIHAVWCGRDPRFGNVNNVATTAAAVATYAAVAAFGAPDLLLSAGTAGGFASMGAAVGDVFLSTKCVFHSRRIPGDAGQLEEYGFGHLRSPPLIGLVTAAGLKSGVVSTSDSLDASELDLELMRSEGAAVKEMEAAAVAWVCSTLAVPFVAIKSITDIVDGPHATAEEFYSNLATASEQLQQKVQLVIRLLRGTRLRAWATPSDLPGSEGEPAARRDHDSRARGQASAAAGTLPRATAQGPPPTGVQREAAETVRMHALGGVPLGVLIGIAVGSAALAIARRAH